MSNSSVRRVASVVRSVRRAPTLAVAAATALTAALLLAPAAAQAQTGYRDAPDPIKRILDAPTAPRATFSPDREWLVLSFAEVDETTIAELAEPTLFLAGRRLAPTPNSKIELVGIKQLTVKQVNGDREINVDIPEGTRIGAMEWTRDGKRLGYFTIADGRMGVRVLDVATGRSRPITAQGLAGRLALASGGFGGGFGGFGGGSGSAWTADGRYLLFTATTPQGMALWVADAQAGTARRLTGPVVNHVSGSCGWVDGAPPAVCNLHVANRGEPPVEPPVPTGPIVQESYGRASPTRTNTYLLEDPHDEALFDYYFTSQIALIGVDGKITRLGEPAVYSSPSVSPDGKYLLVDVTHRPYSYQVGMQNFPERTEVWTLDGKVAKVVYDRPLIDQPSMRDATAPGIRQISWRPDEPATLVMVEALDGGDPRRQVPKRDRVSLLRAPFTSPAEPFVETELRYRGITWLEPKLALLTDGSSARARARTFVIDPSAPNGGNHRLLWDLNVEDRYKNPGSFVTEWDPAAQRDLPVVSSDGRWRYLTGAGGSPEGDRPFLDRIDLATGSTERVWQSEPPYYEAVVSVLDNDAKRVITRRESATERPNYYVRDLTTKSLAKITDLPDPEPFFADVKSELITYTRDDGVKLSATLYLPPKYDKTRDGPLPFFLWAYPREFRSEEAASQVSGSPHQFRRPARQDHLLMLASGYGVLDNPTMPIVGKSGQEPNDNYVPQLVASAKAAVDKIVELGVADRDRVGIGGHSYGAFMTANLLAHSDLFKAGIARSGAYNRTLTPFGFQAEPRTYWQAPEIYNQMSPFSFADKIKEPILLIHGMNDNNQGTFPVQSERMFAALKGNGGNVRYVQLPLESHGYAARESRRHVLWEMQNWLDTYVKNPKPKM